MARGGTKYPDVPLGQTLNVGEQAKPPFVVLPDPATLFSRRAERFLALATGHPLEPYLRFLAAVADAQHDVQPEMPAVSLPDAQARRLSIDHGLPPFSIGRIEPGDAAEAALTGLCKRLAGGSLPPQGRQALTTIEASSRDERAQMMQALLADEVPADKIAEHVLAAAAVQVLLARMAAGLDPAELQPVADGACPVCGGSPVVSLVVGWTKAHGTRFCCCSLCATLWNVSRIRCLICGSDGAVAYHTLEGGNPEIKAETCDDCSAYVKILYQLNDPALDPVADDVASLGLDLRLREEGFKRRSANPFLIGY